MSHKNFKKSSRRANESKYVVEYRTFMRTHRKKSGENHTYTSYGPPKECGSYTINDDDYDEFIRLYSRARMFLLGTLIFSGLKKIKCGYGITSQMLRKKNMLQLKFFSMLICYQKELEFL